MALTTKTMLSPREQQRLTCSATSRMRSAFATDVPPNFWTNKATDDNATVSSAALALSFYVLPRRRHWLTRWYRDHNG